jgi:peroxiredoxin
MGITSSPTTLLPGVAVSFNFQRVTSTKRAAPPSSTEKLKETAMSLQAKLDAFKADFEAGKPPYNVPRSVIETMHRATAELIASEAAQRARKAGDVAPSFSLKDPEGNVVNSADLLQRGPLVLSFYRGVWCPYCNMELQALEAAKPKFDKYGASLVAISPQTAPNSRKSVRQNNLSFPILSDAKGKVGAAFGLRFNLPDYLVELYKQLKNDLPTFNDDPSWTLPMPARYVIGQDGVILYSEVNPDYTRRPEPEDMIPVLQQAAAVKA